MVLSLESFPEPWKIGVCFSKVSFRSPAQPGLPVALRDDSGSKMEQKSPLHKSFDINALYVKGDVL